MINNIAMIIGAVLLGAGLVLWFGWPIVLVLGGLVLLIWGVATQ